MDEDLPIKFAKESDSTEILSVNLSYSIFLSILIGWKFWCLIYKRCIIHKKDNPKEMEKEVTDGRVFKFTNHSQLQLKSAIALVPKIVELLFGFVPYKLPINVNIICSNPGWC